MHPNRWYSDMRRKIVNILKGLRNAFFEFISMGFILFLFSGCGSYAYIKYSDQLYKPITREKLYMPRAGGNGLRSEFQWERNYNRWYNYYFLDLNSFYYNPYFANGWYLHNQWRFNNYWRTQSPKVIPNRRRVISTPTPPIKRDRVYTPSRRGRVIAPTNTAGSTINVSPRSNPNLRNNVQPRRQSRSNVRPSGQNNGRRFKNN